MQLLHHRILLCFLLILFSGSFALAQDRLSLEDAIARVLQQNYNIRAARNSNEQATENNTWGSAGALPTLALNGYVSKGLTNTQQRFTGGRDPQSVRGAQNTIYNASADLNWTIYNGGRVRLAKKQLEAFASLEEERLREQLQSTVAATILAYAAAVFQQQQGVAIDTGLLLARTRMVLSKAKFDIGTSAKTDFLQARVDYNARQSDSLNQQVLLIGSVADLNALMAQDEDKLYQLDENLITNSNLQPLQPELLKEQNPAVAIASKLREVRQLDYKITRTNRLPIFSFMGGYGYTRTTNDAGLLLFNQGFGPSGRISLNLPLYQGGNVRRQIAVAGLEAARTELLYEQQSTESARLYRRAWTAYKMAISALKLEQENIGYARENMEIQQARFRLASGTTLEVREAENGYIQALLRLYTATYNLKVNEVKVLELEGALVD